MLLVWYIKLDQLVSRGPVRGGSEAQDLGRGEGTDRGTMPVLRGPTNVYVLVNPEDVMCLPALVTCLCQPQRRRGHGCLHSCVM